MSSNSTRSPNRLLGTSWYIAQAAAPSTCVAAPRSKIGCIHQGQRSLCGGAGSPRISGNHGGHRSAVGEDGKLIGELIRISQGAPFQQAPDIDEGCLSM